MSELKKFFTSLVKHHVLPFLAFFAVMISVIVFKFGMVPQGLIALGFMAVFFEPLAWISWRDREKYSVKG